MGFRLLNIADNDPFLPVLHIGRDEIIYFPYYQLLLLVILGGVNPVQFVDILLNCTYPRDIAALIERLNGFREPSYKKIKPELMGFERGQRQVASHLRYTGISFPGSGTSTGS